MDMTELENTSSLQVMDTLTSDVTPPLIDVDPWAPTSAIDETSFDTKNVPKSSNLETSESQTVADTKANAELIRTISSVNGATEWNGGVPMGMLHIVTYPVVTFFFLMGCNVAQLPDFPLHLFDNVLGMSMRSSHKWLVVFPILMWCSHFTRRLLEVILIYMSRKVATHRQVIISVSARIVICFCIGWSLNYNLHYEPPAVGFIVVGLLIFVVGEVGNCMSHVHLMRSAERKTIALGGIFNYVSRPHYLFEILTWFGFALTSFTLPTLIFFLMNATILLIRGHQRHAKYRKQDIRLGHDKEYCKKRKAIIPFLF